MNNLLSDRGPPTLKKRKTLDTTVSSNELRIEGPLRRELQSGHQAMVRFVRPGGHLLITCPYNERRYVGDVYKLPGSACESQVYHCSSYDRATVDRWLKTADVGIVRQDYWHMWTGGVWRQGGRVAPPHKTSAAGRIS